ncbi:hypothetical protein COO60DRAFT_655092 [Scenedesmus sp. NREL 46B-D3]|nr:hypothetical protein COO60DRAFT_655092 [Scenedesmus sp. NREL 46B-D3]
MGASWRGVEAPYQDKGTLYYRLGRIHHSARNFFGYRDTIKWVHTARLALNNYSRPNPLPGSATVQNAFSLPQDIWQLTTSDLIDAGASTPKHPWLVVAGWPCQDLSQAGPSTGLQAARVVRPANRTVSIALGPGRHPQEVKAADRFPRCCCNKPGEPMTAWPTFMPHQNSYAFRPGQSGSVITSAGEYDQPTATEREFAECCHDTGGEWAGTFGQLLLDAKIDSRSTSANHPAANGAAENSVHIVKSALKKMCLQHLNMRDWDMEVPWLLLGYNCSP